MLRYNALQQLDHYLVSQSFRFHQLMDNEVTKTEQDVLLRHKWQCHRVDGNYPLHLQQFEMICNSPYLAYNQRHTLHIKLCGVLVLNHL